MLRRILSVGKMFGDIVEHRSEYEIIEKHLDTISVTDKLKKCRNTHFFKKNIS